MKDTSKQIVEILYTNWKGETAVRKILPVKLWYGHTEYHKEDQWLLNAIDQEKQAPRDFALKDIKNWN